jgi:hypothetical protein
MLIYVDESGNFAPAAGQPGSWCAMAAFVIAESQREASFEALRRFKQEAGFRLDQEVKRSDVRDEQAYFRLLMALRHAGGIVASVATDAGLYDGVEDRQREQAALVNAGFAGLDGAAADVGNRLAAELTALSPQLFVDIICRVELAWRVIQLGTMHYVRRHPESLGAFTWRVDAKNRVEPAYRPLWAGVATSLSLRQPLQLLPNGNYRWMDRFVKVPIPASDPTPRLRYDASSLCLDDLEFVDSRTDEGVQIADLVASGIRGCLRNAFQDNARAARLLGRLMRRAGTDDQAVSLLLFAGPEPAHVADETVRAIREIDVWARVLA